MNVDFPNIEATHQQATISTTAQTLAQAGITLHAKTLSVSLAVENGPVRMSVNSNDPTASLGTPIPVDAFVNLSRAEAEQAKFIRSGTVDAVFQVAQYKSE